MIRLAPFIFLLLLYTAAPAQTGYLFVKNGGKKKRVYSEGDRIHFKLSNGLDKKGLITLLRNDTIFLNGEPIPRQQVASLILDDVKKKPFPADVKTMMLISAGVALTGTGLSLNNRVKPGAAFTAAAVIGYGPLLIKHFGGRLLFFLRRKKFRLGKKFHLQVLDFYMPGRKGF